jgi:signal peptidase I
LWDWLKTLVLAAVLAVGITVFVQPTLVRGDSMQPTFAPNDYLVINRWAYRERAPERGDLVVFTTALTDEHGDAKHLIKRVIAVGGDRVNITGGVVRVNDRVIDEPYLSEESLTLGEIEIQLGPHELFVMGDNRLQSLDSRNPMIGPIEEMQLEGEVFFKLYPFEKWGPVN